MISKVSDSSLHTMTKIIGEFNQLSKNIVFKTPNLVRKSTIDMHSININTWEKKQRRKDIKQL